MAAEKERGKSSEGDSSPYIVGVWKFSNNQNPTIDTEFRFINPTHSQLTLEYAFFELDGTTFCGCDRDDFAPNQTTVYTMLQELNLPAPSPTSPFPKVFSCQGTSGALKAIVFKAEKGDRIRLDDALQVGFQTHAFGNLQEPPDVDFLLGSVQTETDMSGIGLNDSTEEEIRQIHTQCDSVNGPLP
jgi:hypothetical protein